MTEDRQLGGSTTALGLETQAQPARATPRVEDIYTMAHGSARGHGAGTITVNMRTRSALRALAPIRASQERGEALQGVLAVLLMLRAGPLMELAHPARGQREVRVAKEGCVVFLGWGGDQSSAGWQQRRWADDPVTCHGSAFGAARELCWRRRLLPDKVRLGGGRRSLEQGRR